VSGILSVQVVIQHRGVMAVSSGIVVFIAGVNYWKTLNFNSYSIV